MSQIDNTYFHTLNELNEGQAARVREIRAEGGMRRRLQDLGLIEGTRVECLQKNAAGDLIAYWIRGAAIALRREDSIGVLIG